MASLVQAVAAYGPRLELARTAQLEDVVEWMAQHTGLNTGEVVMVLYEIHDALLFFSRQGTPVKLPGVGTFTPSIDRHGAFRLNFRADPSLKRGLNLTGAYRGEIQNKGHTGLDNATYKALWDADHADDPLEI